VDPKSNQQTFISGEKLIHGFHRNKRFSNGGSGFNDSIDENMPGMIIKLSDPLMAE